MIREDFKIEEIQYSINTWTGYPKTCDISDDIFFRMVELIDFVEYSPSNVLPNVAFFRMKDLIEQGSFNCRGGHAFRFWFFDEISAKEFHERFGGNFENPPVLPSN